MPARLGVDIGGTFTDLVVIDEATGTARLGNVLTTPKDPAHGVEEGIRALLDDAGVRPDEVRAVVHGTTLATNALIEKKGAKTALLTTAGFRDALEIGREGRYDMYDLFIDPPAPLVPRHLRRCRACSCPSARAPSRRGACWSRRWRSILSRPRPRGWTPPTGAGSTTSSPRWKPREGRSCGRPASPMAT